MKKLIIVALVVIVIAGSAVSGYLYTRKPIEPQVSTQLVSRGDIIQVVGATGTIEAVTTVDVGTQVTGVVKEMFADFNRIVKKGQLVAKIDPATIEATIERDKANLESANASLDSRRITLEDSRNKLRRAEDLYKRKLITDESLETAQVSVKTNEAAITSQLASIKVTQATLNQDQVNLGYTNIYAPIDGIVINRKVDIGQTVVSNNAATSMFQIAADLTKMQVKASVDESDVGLLRPGQRVTFRVDAHPGKEFVGSVAQVRLQPVVSQNVVTYTTIINVSNPNLELKPGMTANVQIQIASRENVLRVPAGALRFRPTREIFDALGIAMPAELLARGRGTATGGQAAPGSGRAPDAFARGGGDREAGEAASGKGIADRGATTIDALFGALTFTATPGRVWVYAVDPATRAKSLKAIAVRTGISDGSFVELINAGELAEGREVVTGVDTGQASTARPGSNPLMPGRSPMIGGGGGHGGGPH
jgi:HlyD family secretion protein